LSLFLFGLRQIRADVRKDFEASGCYASGAMSYLYKHFQAVSGSPRPLQIDSLFGGVGEGSTYTSNTSELLVQLIDQVNTQTAEVSNLVGEITGKSSGSALQNVLSGTSFGGSALGGLASAAQSGFSWQSILKDVFPIGGLISGIAGLFESAPTPPPLNQYDAPPSLNFDAVLNANGTLSQGSVDQYGYTRASSGGLDFTDAEGGPYSPYQRASNGSLLPVAGDPTTRYTGTLNLPEMLQPLVQPNNQTPSLSTGGSTSTPTVTAPSASPSAPGLSSTNASLTADPNNQVPSFDQQWFNDHGSLIASAVRAQLLNYHPIVDTINDL
jgi:hypothetical protein